MSSLISRKLQAGVLCVSLLLPAEAALGNDWSKEQSRTRGTVIGAVAGALVAGKKGALVGAAVGNGVQYVSHTQSHKHKTYRATRHYTRR